MAFRRQASCGRSTGRRSDPSRSCTTSPSSRADRRSSHPSVFWSRMTDALAVGRSSPVSERGTRQTAWMRSDTVLRGAVWVLVAIAVIGAGVVFVELTDMRPEYDAYGWLVWGRQTLHWNLDTNGAPSWKPLTFLFTVPYALAGNTQPWLWMVTAVASAFAGPVFAARIAYRVGAPAPRYA